MPPSTPATVRKAIASGDIAPLYLLVGEDDQEKAALAGEIAGTIEAGLEAFNLERLYGGETTSDRLIDLASTLPMMAPRRIIVVLEAEKLLMPKGRESRAESGGASDKARARDKAQDAQQARFEDFLNAPPAHATVVFASGPLNPQRRVVKALERNAQVVDCGTITSAADAERWVKTRAAKDRIPLDAGAVRALVARGGTDLVRLRAGVERVALYALGAATITAQDVQQAVPAGPEAQADFGVAKAIWRGDAKTALREVDLALEAGTTPFMMMGQLRAAAEKLPGNTLKGAMDAVLRTDLGLKSSAGDARVLLERLVMELCGAAGRGTSGSPGYRR